jgi:hypothetical protein
VEEVAGLPGNQSSMVKRDPWAMVWCQPYIDADRLADAIQEDLRHREQPDFRTRLLTRDCCRALEKYWGPAAFRRWVDQSPVRSKLDGILHERLGRIGFGYIRRRLVDPIRREDVARIFALIGERLRKPVTIYVAGSIPTIVLELTSRPTLDIDVVDEVPEPIRTEREVLDKIKRLYGISLGHVQRHYLPVGWQDRVSFFGTFGRLTVQMADPIDIFVSKLSSKQEKHRLDLEVLGRHLERAAVRRRLVTAGRPFLETPRIRDQMEVNWKFLFGEPLPTPEDA